MLPKLLRTYSVMSVQCGVMRRWWEERESGGSGESVLHFTLHCTATHFPGVIFSHPSNLHVMERGERRGGRGGERREGVREGVREGLGLG
jgi:hypothetical protein